MKAPDTIYIAPNHESIIYGRGWFELRHADTDTAYVRADLPYELSKTVESQKAEIDTLASDCNSLSLVNQELKGEIARLQKALQFYADIGNHRGNTRTGYVPIVDAHNLGDIARAALASPPPGGLQFSGEATQDQSGEFKVTLPGSDWS